MPSASFSLNNSFSLFLFPPSFQQSSATVLNLLIWFKQTKGDNISQPNHEVWIILSLWIALHSLKLFSDHAWLVVRVSPPRRHQELGQKRTKCSRGISPCSCKMSSYFITTENVFPGTPWGWHLIFLIDNCPECTQASLPCRSHLLSLPGGSMSSAFSLTTCFVL